MNALAQIEHPTDDAALQLMSTDVEKMAIQLANEGIPVRAIARAINIPSTDLYQFLRDALEDGALVELPKDDWPPGSSRAQRAVLATSSLNDEATLQQACARFFKTTPQEAGLLAALLRRSQVTKAQLHTIVDRMRPENTRSSTDPKIVDVLICRLRKKLKAHNITVETLWAVGYLISTPDRDAAIKLLTKFLSEG